MKDLTNVLIVLFSIVLLPLQAQEVVKGELRIDTAHGHELELGASGFNVRIADKVWGYTHPEFRQAVHQLQPGWLRYFSGTMGDAFSAATGQYNLDYAMMMDHRGQFLKGHRFTQVKGPHRIIDLYDLLGEVGGKLVVTINGFTETPEMTKALAEFCKDNHIIVEAWQFCNEPYFYVPNRNRYWWNDGYDYAQKMKPHADAIREVFPDAKMALNFTWDGIWGFMKEINRYQIENGAYWNVFSKHSYAPHIGGKESFDQAMRRANSKIIEATSDEAMEEIEAYTEEDIPLLITEFGVWNRPLNGIFSGIYNTEYTLRQLSHSNAFLIGSHEVSNKIRPASNKNQLIENAYAQQIPIDTDTIMSGLYQDEEGKGLQLLHEATNNSRKINPVIVTGTRKVPGLKNDKVESVYAMHFEGVNGLDYLAVTNRSEYAYTFDLKLDNETVNGEFTHKYIWSKVAENKNVPIEEQTYQGNTVAIKPFSVNVIQWPNGNSPSHEATRIYSADVVASGVRLDWWERKKASNYEVTITDQSGTISHKEVNSNQTVITDLKEGEEYTFEVAALYNDGKSEPSNPVTVNYALPEAPKIFKLSQRDTTFTLFWESEKNTNGYQIEVKSKDGSFMETYDTKNVFGYRVSGLQYDQQYTISLRAYNGLGTSQSASHETITLEEDFPIPARNISATETRNGNVYLEWIAQDTLNPGVRYNIYRGKAPHDFTLYQEAVEGTHFIDESSEGLDYFYTVKAVNSAGEASFYPNVATVIKRDPAYTLEISEVTSTAEGLQIKVATENLDVENASSVGVKLNDVSFLNLEEVGFEAQSIKNDHFEVVIPWTKLNGNRSYFVKAYVKSRSGEKRSLPPFHKIRTPQ
ncbi:hypothetical protein DN752_22545 [Echinicola strongylocentroti]|uniref:Fibronectin type-III domain-containing protein n=1 Tax=Echinicola strongylocentroti TaxID=1795355 RepID=A0A2Z4IPQ8_9BACT|nr:fibronectin type III domain-containing protein [Echinicola strongylocentroti]AWW32699.1 hypothetical protein DN752_22545 [Echinicola strongylocentroti]